MLTIDIADEVENYVIKQTITLPFKIASATGKHK